MSSAVHHRRSISHLGPRGVDVPYRRLVLGYMISLIVTTQLYVDEVSRVGCFDAASIRRDETLDLMC